MGDLLAQVFSERSRIGAERWCGYNGFLGLMLLGGGLVLRLSGPPDPLGALGFVFVMACGGAILATII